MPDKAPHLSLSDNHCQECGMLVEPPGAFHPRLFCLLKKADPRCDPWEEFKWAVERVADVKLPAKAPLVRNLPMFPLPDMDYELREGAAHV